MPGAEPGVGPECRCGPAGDASVNHLGFRVPDTATLVEEQRRLEEARISTLREDGVACCYARQTKFWVTDPDGMQWELYVLEEDLNERGPGAVPLGLVADGAARNCCEG